MVFRRSAPDLESHISRSGAFVKGASLKTPPKKALRSFCQLVSGFSTRGFLFCEGGNLNSRGCARTGCNHSFCFFVRDLLVESYTDAEIFTGIRREMSYCKTVRARPQLLRFPPSPWQCQAEGSSWCLYFALE